MLVNHKIQFFSIILFFYFEWIISAFLLQYDIIFSLVKLTHVTLSVWIAQGKAISEFRSPKALPCTPTLLGTELALHLRCVTQLTVVCMLRYLEWNVVPSWFLYTSLFNVQLSAGLISVCFLFLCVALCRTNLCMLLYSICSSLPS